MAASTEKMSADAPVFSYAQAAKGVAPVQTQQANPAATPVDEKTSAPASDSNPETSMDTEVASTNGVAEPVSKAQEPIEVDMKKSASGTSTPSHTTSSTATLPKEDDASSTPNGSSDSTWDKQSQVSSSVDRSSQATEASKEKASDNGWEKTPVPAKELKAAPIPAVNIWQQRREAQDAKTKAMSKHTSATISKTSSASKYGATTGRDKKKAADTKSKDDCKRSRLFPSCYSYSTDIFIPGHSGSHCLSE